MARRHTLSLEAIHQSLNTECPHCHHVITPAERHHSDTNLETATLLPKAKALTTSGAAWNRHCANKQGKDLTYITEHVMNAYSR